MTPLKPSNFNTSYDVSRASLRSVQRLGLLRHCKQTYHQLDLLSCRSVFIPCDLETTDIWQEGDIYYTALELCSMHFCKGSLCAL